MKGQPLPAKYNGYGNCPIVVGYGKLILAEFDYSNNPSEAFTFEPGKPRWGMRLLKNMLCHVYTGKRFWKEQCNDL